MRRLKCMQVCFIEADVVIGLENQQRKSIDDDTWKWRHCGAQRAVFIHQDIQTSRALARRARARTDLDNSQRTQRTDRLATNMGKLFSKLLGSKEMRILMLGLDNAGKTSTPSHPHPSQSIPIPGQYHSPFFATLETFSFIGVIFRGAARKH